ncbi:MAG: hypothetical protein ACOVQA_08450 [Thermoflexibacteraceae bacterium]|jgi:hypothetical protein
MQPIDNMDNMEKEWGFLPLLIHEAIYVEKKLPVANVTPTPKVPEQVATETVKVQEGQPILFILVETDYLAPAEQDTLVKIVEAVGLSFAQTQKITIAKYKPVPIDYPHYCISFSQQRPPFIINERYLVVKRDNKKLLWADTLEVLVNDKTKKIQLWKCLKEMFALNSA